MLCETCNGSCCAPGTEPVTCDICRGSGQIQRTVRSLLGNEIDAPAPDLSGIVDNLLLIRFAQEPMQITRQLSILKIRDNAYDPSILELALGAQGMNVNKVGLHGPDGRDSASTSRSSSS